VPRAAHSEKPNEIRDNITAMFPTQQKTELFARKSISGWDSWGLDMKLSKTQDFELAAY
jgi:N6-adenosine-specific RNA methylase IME4